MRAASSSLTLDTVNTTFDRNFSFTQGSLFIDNDVQVTGTSQFAYSSLQPMYIEPFSKLHFDIGTTFSYSPGVSGPHTSAQRNLVNLIDRTSQLYFDNCTINVPDYGIQLTRGTILFDNRIVINGNTANLDTAHSFQLGDGTSVDNDVEIKVLGEANAIMNGYMYHNPATP